MNTQVEVALGLGTTLTKSQRRIAWIYSNAMGYGMVAILAKNLVHSAVWVGAAIIIWRYIFR